MKRVLSAFILVLVLVPLMLLMRWGGEAKAPWSAATDGVRARLVSPRFLWRADESVSILLRLENRGEAPAPVAYGSAELRIRHEGRLMRVDSRAWTGDGPLVLEPGATTDVVLLDERLDAEGTGLYAFEGTLGPFALAQLKVRLLEPRASAASAR